MLTRTTSAALNRRTSSLTLRVRGRQLSPQKHAYPRLSIFKSTAPRLPIEVIEVIVDFMVLSCPLGTSFAAIASFSLVSTAFRELVLRRYFQVVIVESSAHFSRLLDMLMAQTDRLRGCNSLSWIRAFIAPTGAITRQIHHIGSFASLRTLEICFTSEGFMTQDLVVGLLLNAYTGSITRYGLNKLVFSEIPRIDTKLLALIAKTFPRLTTLELTSTKRIEWDCCFVCLRASLPYTRHSPIPDYSLTVEKLAASFAHALEPMDKLKDLYLGLFLSDTHFLEEHIAHSDADTEGRGLFTDLFQCAICGDHRAETRERESTAALILAKSLPSLTCIQWDSLLLRAKKSHQLSEASGHDSFYETPKAPPIRIGFDVDRRTGTVRIQGKQTRRC